MRESRLSVEAATAAVLVAFCLGILTAGWSWTDPSSLPTKTDTVTEQGGTIPPFEASKP